MECVLLLVDRLVCNGTVDCETTPPLVCSTNFGGDCMHVIVLPVVDPLVANMY